MELPADPPVGNRDRIRLDLDSKSGSASHGVFLANLGALGTTKNPVPAGNRLAPGQIGPAPGARDHGVGLGRRLGPFSEAFLHPLEIKPDKTGEEEDQETVEEVEDEEKEEKLEH